MKTKIDELRIHLTDTDKDSMALAVALSWNGDEIYVEQSGDFEKDYRTILKKTLDFARDGGDSPQLIISSSIVSHLLEYYIHDPEGKQESLNRLREMEV